MKQFENKTTEIPHHEEKRNLNYTDLITHCLNTIPQGGYSVEEMEQRLRIKAVTDSANGKVKLEDADYSKLNELVKGSTWAILHADIVTFKKDVENAKEVK